MRNTRRRSACRMACLSKAASSDRPASCAARVISSCEHGMSGADGVTHRRGAVALIRRPRREEFRGEESLDHRGERGARRDRLQRPKLVALPVREFVEHDIGLRPSLAACEAAEWRQRFARVEAFGNLEGRHRRWPLDDLDRALMFEQQRRGRRAVMRQRDVHAARIDQADVRESARTTADGVRRRCTGRCGRRRRHVRSRGRTPPSSSHSPFLINSARSGSIGIGQPAVQHAPL